MPKIGQWLAVLVSGDFPPVTSGGYQKQLVLVKSAYSPDGILVERGKPVRLKFVRQESSSCSEMVPFPVFGMTAKPPEGETVPLEVLPKEPGEYEFACQMGMFRRKIIVE